MKAKTWIALAAFAVFTNAYADINPGVTEGAEDYDWETCVSRGSADCANDCANSEDINCQDNCTSLAKDKCQSKGLHPD